MVDVIGTDELEAWYLSLGEDDTRAVDRLVDLLAAKGLALGAPRSSAVNGATFALRELRHSGTNNPLRVFYAFDPHRDAILIIGGNKKGDDRFYERMVPLCERIWAQYLAEEGWRK